MSATREICSRMDTAYEDGNLDEALKEVRRLANLRVWGKVPDFPKELKQAIIEDCFSAAGIGKFEGRNNAKFSTWVYRLIGNQINNAIRGRQKERSNRKKYLGLEDLEDIDAEQLGFNVILPFGSQGYPSELAREVFDMREQGLNLKQIAEKKRTTHAAMRKRVSRWYKQMGWSAV